MGWTFQLIFSPFLALSRRSPRLAQPRWRDRDLPLSPLPRGLLAPPRRPSRPPPSSPPRHSSPPRSGLLLYSASHRDCCKVRSRMSMARCYSLTRFNTIAIQATTLMASDKEAVGLSRVHVYEYKCIQPLRCKCRFCS